MLTYTTVIEVNTTEQQNQHETPYKYQYNCSCERQLERV